MPRSRKTVQGRIRVGCAGWSIPAAHRALFGGGGSVLARYATRFDLVEINSSFYRPHRRATYARWASEVPGDFRFAVKVPRAITHDARLRGAGPLLDAFLEECDGLGDKLGCLLVQLPPSLAFDARAASTFFALLRRRWNGCAACEPRHASWFSTRADALLRRHRIARVAADPALHSGGDAPAGDAAFAYWRWHGAPDVYYSAYADDDLRRRARDVSAVAADSGTDAFVVFDNTARGHAVPNAAIFQAALSSATAR